MIIGLELKLSVLCPSCNARTPLVGLHRTPTCHHCLKPISLADLRAGASPLHKYYFGGCFDVVQETIALLEDGQAGATSALDEYRLEYKRQRPHCLSCGASFSDEAIRAPWGRIVCSCGAATPVRARDPELTELDPRILCVIGDAGDVPAQQRPAHPIELECLSCGGALQVDGSGRAVTCTHCRTDTHLPDEVWLRLHPAPPEQPCFLVIEADAREEVMARMPFCYDREGQERTSELQSADPADRDVKTRLRGEPLQKVKVALTERLKALLLPESRPLLRAMLRSEAPYERVACRQLLGLPEAAALMPELLQLAADQLLEHALEVDAPATLLTALARSADVPARRLIAQLPSLPPEPAAVLAGDSDATIRTALAARGDLPEAVVTQLASDQAVQVRSAVARNPATPAPLLKQLRKDPAAEVQASARQNESYQPGLLSRLLGG